jgi:agmatine deiminase
MHPRTLMTTFATFSTAATAAAAWRMPDEGEPHQRTWMAFTWNATLWEDVLPVVQQNLADVAAAISRFEPVSMLVRPQDKATASKLLGNAPNVTLVEGEFDDLWMRDTGPVFVRNDSGVAGVNFNFNGWGNKQYHAADAKVAGQVASAAGVELIGTELVLEGGALEVDGLRTAIITESCVLNNNRNPGWSKEQVEAELERLLGITKVIWLPGIAGKDITDGHTDFYARFVGEGHVVAGFEPDTTSFDHNVTTTHLGILRSATDARGQPFNVTVMNAPTTVRREWRNDEDFAAGYINFYVCNGGVIAPQFGDSEADAAALEILQTAFPDREIVQLNIDGIAAGGGGIHCATQQEIARDPANPPAAPSAQPTTFKESSGARRKARRWLGAVVVGVVGASAI